MILLIWSHDPPYLREESDCGYRHQARPAGIVRVKIIFHEKFAPIGFGVGEAEVEAHFVVTPENQHKNLKININKQHKTH